MESQMTFPGSASPKFRFVAAAAAFATLYFVTAELTSSLAGDVGIAVLWPASGVYLGLMLVAPRHSWPALALGAGLGSLAAYAHAGSSLELSVAFAVPSSAEGLLGAVLIERIVRGRFRLGGLRDVSALVIGSAGGAPPPGAVGRARGPPTVRGSVSGGLAGRGGGRPARRGARPAPGPGA